MANLNKVMLIGNITRDIELKYTPKGQAVCEVGLAVNRKSKNPETGEVKEETTFVDITLWGRQAEVAKEYARKGSPLYVEGRLQLDTWDDKQSGQKRSKLRVSGESIQLLGTRNGGNSGGDEDDAGDERPAPRSQPAPARSQGGGGNQQRPGNGGNQQRPRPAPAAVQDDDDDIPF